MNYTFTAKGHPNILATHKTTLEITKDTGLTKEGDCIIAVAADFSLERVQEIIRNCSDGKIRLTIEAGEVKEEVTAVANPGFCSDREIVLRKGNFLSERTLGTRADKAAADLDKGLAAILRNHDSAVCVTVELI